MLYLHIFQVDLLALVREFLPKTVYIFHRSPPLYWVPAQVQQGGLKLEKLTFKKRQTQPC
jgi:hypothetical protein